MGQVAQGGSKDDTPFGKNPTTPLELAGGDVLSYDRQLLLATGWLNQLGFRKHEAYIDMSSQCIRIGMPGRKTYSIMSSPHHSPFKDNFIKFLGQYADEKPTYYIKIVDCQMAKILFTSRGWNNYYVLNKDDTTKVFWDAFKEECEPGILLTGACLKIMADSENTPSDHVWDFTMSHNPDLDYGFRGMGAKGDVLHDRPQGFEGTTSATKATTIYNPYLVKFLGFKKNG